MIISYKKLWKLLIDRDLKRKDLREMAGISPSTIAKLGRSENINTDVIIRICRALNCDICDILEIVQIVQSESLDEEFSEKGPKA